MRIIAGERRGFKLLGPPGRGARPTSDMVREAMFNILGPSVEGAIALDLFAGTGALGLEALSRGADEAILVEADPDNARVIRRNAESLRYEGRARIFVTDAHRFARAFQADPDRPVVAFVDPPYAEFERRSRKIRDTLAKLWRRLPAGSRIVIESGEHSDDELLPAEGRWDVRRYGGTKIAIAEKTPGDESDDDDAPPVSQSDSDPEPERERDSRPGLDSSNDAADAEPSAPEFRPES